MSFAEWQAVYRAPNFGLQGAAPAIMSAVFQAFQPWNITLANVSAKPNPANAGDVAIIFNLSGAPAVFSVGVGAATLSVRDPAWSEEELIAQIAGAGLQAVQTTTGITIGRHLLSLGMHLKPLRRSVREISATFLAVTSPSMNNETIKARGFSVYGEDFSWVVDASALHDGAFFLKIVRTFDPKRSFSEMVRTLRGDQNELLGVLQLTVD